MYNTQDYDIQCHTCKTSGCDSTKLVGLFVNTYFVYSRRDVKRKRHVFGHVMYVRCFIFGTLPHYLFLSWFHSQKPYACQIPGCTKRYTDPSSLRKHVKAHSAKGLQEREVKVTEAIMILTYWTFSREQTMITSLIKPSCVCKTGLG